MPIYPSNTVTLLVTPPGGYVLILWVDLSVSKSNEQICIKFSPEVCLAPRNNRLHVGDDLNYDVNAETAL